MERTLYSDFNNWPNSEQVDWVRDMAEANDWDTIDPEDDNTWPWETIGECMGEDLSCDIDNLKPLDEVTKYDTYILLGDIGRWNGRVQGYAEAKSIEAAIQKSYSGLDYVKISIIDNDLVVSGSHHDGHNSSVIRAWRNDSDDEARGRVRDAIYENKKNASSLFDRHAVKLGKYIGQIYGWK